MPSARRVGTNESISTYGAGQDYVLLATWEADTDNDNVTAQISPVLECLAAQYDDSISLSSAVNNATYFRILRPKPGNFHTGIRDTGVRFYSTADGTTITFLDEFDQVQDVCARTTQNSVTSRVAVNFSTACTDAALVGCILTNSQNAGTGANIGINSAAGATNRHFVIDCISEGNENDGIRIASTASVAPVIYNTTVAGNGAQGFDCGANATIALVNCLGASNVGGDFSGSIDSGSNNASEDTTALGTSPRTSQTFTFVNAAGFDYHLAAADAGAKGFGIDLSGDVTYAFDDDIDRQLFGNAWDIGFDAVRAGITRNTRSNPLGIEIGMGWRMPV